jgi:hypothetical protein
MLVDVETFFLDSLVYSQSCYVLDCPEEDDTGYSCPCIDNDDTKDLSSKETEA